MMIMNALKDVRATDALKDIRVTNALLSADSNDRFIEKTIERLISKFRARRIEDSYKIEYFFLIS